MFDFPGNSTLCILFLCSLYCRLPRLSSGGNEKAQEPMSPASTDTCQSPVNRKVTWILTSPDSKQSLLREECKNNCTKGIISETSMPFITEMPTRKSCGGRMRSKTWNGKALPRLQYERFSPRMRSFSEEDRRLRKQSDLSERTSNNAHGHISHKKCKDVFQDGSKIAGTKPREISRMSFPTAEDVQCRKFLSPPNFSIRKSSSMNSLKSRDSLPPVIEEQSHSSVFMNSEAVPGEGAAGTCQLPSSGKNSKAYHQNPACHSRPGWGVQRRLRPLSRQGGVLEDASNNNASSFPSDSPTESPRGHESGASAARKASTKCKTSLTVNGLKQSQEPKTHKDTSITSERLTARSSSLSSQTTKRRESLRSKEKRSSLGTPEEDLLPEAVKVKWLKVLKKVFNVNLFLNGMVALQTQREMDRVALEQKQAALENVYEELKHCRYLRLPSQEDESGHDCVSWAFNND